MQILLIDDDDDDRVLIRRILMNSEQEVVVNECVNAHDGLKALKSTHFDCALVDQNLPDGSGLDIIQQANDEQIKTPIIILTGHSNDRLIVEIMRSGGSDYLTKDDLSTELLLHSINNVIRFKGAEQEKQRVLMALNDEELKTRAILESAVDSIISINKYGVIESANHATTVLFGYENEELIGLGVDVIMPEEMAEDCDDSFAKYIQGDKTREITIGTREIKGIHKSGYEIDIELAVSRYSIGGTNFSLCVIRDIRSRKKLQLEVELNQQRLRYSQELAELGIWDLNLENGSLFWSEKVSNILGIKYHKSNYTLDDFIERVLPKDKKDVIQAFNNCLDKAIPYDIEHRIVWPDGTVHWIQGRGGVVYDKNSRPDRIVGIFLDITDRKESDLILSDTLKKLRNINKQLRDAQDKLIQSEKMASIGQLAAGVAHEINNPIGYISSNVGSLKQYVNDLFRLTEAYESAMAGELDESSKNNLQRIRDEVDMDFIKIDLYDLIKESEEGVSRVKKIVQDLKDFSHVEESEWQLANIENGLDSTLNVVRNEIKYKANVVKEYGDIPDIECSISQLNQVFMNIFVNASHAMEEGTLGTITIRTYEEDSGVVISIEDTGKGMTEETAYKIFEPFFTTKPIGQGTGLGLSLSYGIINKHNGKITVKSKVGEGTQFIIWLPIHQVDKLPDQP